MWIHLQNIQRLGPSSCHTFHLPLVGPQIYHNLSPKGLSIDAPPRFLGLVCLSIACKLYEGKSNFDLAAFPPERLTDVGISEILSTKELGKLELDFLSKVDFDLVWASPVAMLEIFLQHFNDAILQRNNDLSLVAHRLLSLAFQDSIRTKTDWKLLCLSCLLAAYAIVRGSKNVIPETLSWATSRCDLNRNHLQSFSKDMIDLGLSEE